MILARTRVAAVRVAPGAFKPINTRPPVRSIAIRSSSSENSATESNSSSRYSGISSISSGKAGSSPLGSKLIASDVRSAGFVGTSWHPMVNAQLSPGRTVASVRLRDTVGG